jgi:hypothetical protein
MIDGGGSGGYAWVGKNGVGEKTVVFGRNILE